MQGRAVTTALGSTGESNYTVLSTNQPLPNNRGPASHSNPPAGKGGRKQDPPYRLLVETKQDHSCHMLPTSLSHIKLHFF